MTKKAKVDDEVELVEAAPLLGPNVKYKPQKIQEEDKSCAEVICQPLPTLYALPAEHELYQGLDPARVCHYKGARQWGTGGFVNL